MENRNRREFLKILGAGFSFLSLPIIDFGCACRPDKPNIIFILADDLGYGDLSCLNPESKIKTPNLDRLASQGITFSDAHSGSAVCTPTRYGLLTGRYAWRSQLKSSVLWPWDEPLIEPGRLTVADFLSQQGYTTACIGKWHLGWDWPTNDNSRINPEVPVGKLDSKRRIDFGKKVIFTQPIKNGPVTKGFDYYFGDDVPNFPPYCFIENERTLGLPDGNKPDDMFGFPGPCIKGWDLEKVMPALTRKSEEFIRAGSGTPPFYKKSERPFFLYFTLTAPHTPIAPSDDFKGTSKAGLYGDYVQEVDWTVGQIMKTLEETGQAENTLIVFASDNGSPGRDGTGMSGPVGSVKRFGHFPSYIYRGIKADIWEGGHRVPFIAKWPGKIAAGRRSSQIVCLTDFFATCAAIFGEQLPGNAGEDSFNILPVLLDENDSAPVRDAVVHHSISGMFALRKGQWKLIDGKGSGGWSKDGSEDPAPGQLYDVYKDPGEKNNLYLQKPEIVHQLKALLEKFKNGGRTRPL